MNKDLFLQRLRDGLQRLPREEHEDAMQYYEEYLAEAGPEQEQAVLAELGDPARLAASIVSESMLKTIDSGEKTLKKGFSNIWVAVLAVFAAPIAFPVAVTIAALAFALAVTVAAIFFAFSLTVLILLVVGIGVSVYGVGTLFSQPLFALYSLGGGMICIGLAILIAIGSVALTRICYNGISQMLSESIRRRNVK